MQIKRLTVIRYRRIIGILYVNPVVGEKMAISGRKTDKTSRKFLASGSRFNRNVI